MSYLAQRLSLFEKERSVRRGPGTDVLGGLRHRVGAACWLMAGMALPSVARSEESGDAVSAARTVMKAVGPGMYRPLYPPTPRETEIPVRRFFLDRLPVTNRDFARFVRANLEWRRSAPSRILADESYLSHWQSDVEPGEVVGGSTPVVRVSWFAAKAFCAARHARLPTEAEWELAAAASATQADAANDPVWRDKISAWYASPTPKRLDVVGKGVPNVWGVVDLHGLVWEWVLDFNSSLVTGDSRESGDKDKMRFCGAGALGATDKTDYVKFMRVAFRSSLRADFTTGNLGFRCAADDDGGQK